MTLLLDTGALIALERNDRMMWRRMKSALLTNEIPVTHGGIVGQAWRGRGPRSARLGQALASVDVRALDERLGRRSGELLARGNKSDVIHAALVLLCADGDVIATSDPDDLKPLAQAAGLLIHLLIT